MQSPLWIGAGAALALAIASGFGEARRQRRRNMDDVGFMPWQLIQLLAVIGAVVLVSLAVNLR